MGSLTLGWVLALVAVSVATVQPPRPPRKAAADQFSSVRAMAYLQVIAEAPHPIGSPRQESVRRYLMAQLAELGLQPQDGPVETVSAQDGHIAARVHDIVARLPGTARGGRSVVLMAHYDSVAVAPGGADDGSGVAVLLETARALRAGPRPRNDVLFVFTDGEEKGMLGAQAFVNSAWARGVGVVFNFDNPGSRGPALMYQTSPGNGALVREYARAVHDPFASSLMYEAVRGRVIVSDFSMIRSAGMPGMSFAVTEGFQINHTGLDTVDTIDSASIQHEGDAALALARHFGGLDLTRLKGADVVYFNPLGFWLVMYSGPVAMGLLLATALAFGGVVWLGLRRRRLTLGGMLGGAFVAPLLLAATAAVVALWWIVARSWYLQPGFPGVMLYNDNLHRAGLVALVAGVAAWLYLPLLGGMRLFDLVVGNLLWWLILAAATTAAAPGASYLLVWPLLAMLAALAFVFAVDGRGSAAGTPAAATDLAAVRRPSSWIALCLGITPGVVLLTSSTYVFLISVGLRIAGTVAAVLLLMPLVLPLLAPLARGRHWVWPLAVTALGLGVLIGVSPRAGFDRAYPRQDRVFYRLNGDTRQATWGTFEGDVDPWMRQFLGAAPQHLVDPGYIPHRGWDDYWVAAAPDLGLRAPEIAVESDRLVPGGRELIVHVRSLRSAPLLTFTLESIAGDLRASVDGLPLSAGYTTQLDGTPVRWLFEYYDLPPEGVDVRMVMQRGGGMRLRAIDESYGLPQVPSLAYRPRSVTMMPGASGDFTIVERVVDVPAAPVAVRSAPTSSPGRATVSLPPG